MKQQKAHSNENNISFVLKYFFQNKKKGEYYLMVNPKSFLINKQGSTSSKLPVIMAALAVLLLVGYFVVQFQVKKDAKKTADQLVDSVKEFIDIKYDGLNVSLLSRKVSLEGVGFTFVKDKGEFSADKITVADYNHDEDKKIPSSMNIKIYGFKKLYDDNDQKNLEELGYYKLEDMKTDGELSYTYSHESRDLNVKKLFSTTSDIGSFYIKFHLSDISLESNNMMTFIMSLGNIKIHDAEFIYKDDSFANRILKAIAKKQNISVDEFKEKVIPDILSKITDNKDSDLQKNVVNAIEDFLENLKGFTITVKPDKPLKLSDIEKANGPDELIKLLNLTIKSH